MDETSRFEEADFLLDPIKNCIIHLMLSDPNTATRLKSIPTGRGKVDYILRQIQNYPEFKEIMQVKKSKKSNYIAEKLRNDGNNWYRRKEFMKALKHYSQSLLKAEKGSAYQALAYGNRSAIFFHTTYYKECVQDIDRAFCCNCPDSLKEKLQSRKSKASALLDRSKTIDYCWPFLPKITIKHPVIESAASCVEINGNPEVGRYIVATRDIQVGEVLSMEKPYAQQMYGSKYVHCHECLKPCFDLIPCENCTTTLYCTDACMEKAKKLHHKYECDVPVFGKCRSLALKTFLIGQNEDKNLVFKRGYVSDRFLEIMNLCTNEHKRSLANLLYLTISTCIIFSLLEKHTKFFNEAPISKGEAKEILYKLTMIVKCNYLAQDKTHLEGKIEGLASEIYSFSSLYNHSCVSNCFFANHGEYLIVRSMENIKKGEECSVSYGVSYDRFKYSLRQNLFQSKYQFKCKCQACINKWPLCKMTVFSNAFSASLPPAVVEHMENWLKYQQDKDPGYVDKVIRDIAPLINTYSQRQPSDHLMALKHLMYEIFCYLGNKVFEL